MDVLVLADQQEFIYISSIFQTTGCSLEDLPRERETERERERERERENPYLQRDLMMMMMMMYVPQNDWFGLVWFGCLGFLAYQPLWVI